MPKKNIHLLCIDPQYDFCSPEGALSVAGADQDMVRLGTMINRIQSQISEIHVTLDSHNQLHIAHPISWIDKNGNHPSPFTVISVKDVENGVWRPFKPEWYKRFFEYVKTLQKNNRYELRIWPPHCIIGTYGHSVYSPASDAIQKWSFDKKKNIRFVYKGTNRFTEHYSAVEAAVIDKYDNKTKNNFDLCWHCRKADEVVVAGEALSHCVKHSLIDLFDYKSIDIKRFVLLTDATSPVAGFEKVGEDFIKAMVKKGMRLSTTVDYLC